MKQIVDLKQAQKLYSKGIKCGKWTSHRDNPDQFFADCTIPTPTIGELIEWCVVQVSKVSMQRVEVYAKDYGNETKWVWNVFEIGKPYVIETEELIDALVDLCIKIKEEQG